MSEVLAIAAAVIIALVLLPLGWAFSKALMDAWMDMIREIREKLGGPPGGR